MARLWCVAQRRRAGRGRLLNRSLRAVAEVIDDPDFGVLGIEFGDIIGGIDLIDRHNLNSADASILASFLGFAQAQPAGTVCVLAAADQRLLRAAQAEGLTTFNPERIAAVDVPAFLAAL